MATERSPDLGDLIAHVVNQVRSRGSNLTRTKLVKLLYLIDIEAAEVGATPPTGLRWRFLHYGPYAGRLGTQLEHMEGRRLQTRRFNSAVLYVSADDPPDTSWWPSMTESRVDRVLNRWARAELNELLDYVYFRTAPMRDARRGDDLDLSRARGEHGARIHIPLEPPEPPDDIEGKIAQWRERHRRRLAPLQAEPPLAVVDLEPEPDIDTGASGQIRVETDEPL